MKTLVFAKRCALEILRDPLNLMFGLGFPIVLLLLLSAIQASIPVALFEISYLAPGIAVFGLSFITLFSATLISRDRESALLSRLYSTPLRPLDFILGYTLPLIPISIVQCAVCYAVAFILGLQISANVIIAIIAIIPTSILYIGLGLLCGSIFNVRQVGGICGALLTNLSAWLSGIWFDIELIGGVFEKVARMLPFIHAVELERAMVSGCFTEAVMHLIIVLGYAIFILASAAFAFLKQMKNCAVGL